MAKIQACEQYPHASPLVFPFEESKFTLTYCESLAKKILFFLDELSEYLVTFHVFLILETFACLSMALIKFHALKSLEVFVKALN